jgi:N-acetylglucosamine kinase-like BadF-type ATPase
MAPLPSTRAEQALRSVYRDGWSREQVAALGALVSRCAAAGDEAAARILDRAAAELGALVAAVSSRLGWGARPLPVVAVGGLLAAGPPLIEPLQRWLAAVLPHALWTAPMGSPLEGAALLAREEGRLCPTP